MRTAAAIGLGFVVGALVGAAVLFRLRPASSDWCCQKVATGTRERAGALCGPACQELGDWLHLWAHAPALVQAIGG